MSINTLAPAWLAVSSRRPETTRFLHPMIITRLAGGLGNQIFQWAACAALRGANERAIFCTRSLNQYKVARALELARFFELPEWFKTETDSSTLERIGAGAAQMRLGRLLPGLGVNDANFAEHLHVKLQGKNRRARLLDGYFQRNWPWTAFDVVRQEIAGRLRVQSCWPAAATEFDCVLHVRGGDFLASEHMKVTGQEFYAGAISTLKQRRRIQSIYVVTDDPPHAAAALRGLETTFPDILVHIPNEPGEMASDFMMIRDAKLRIIGNSTFAWWAAALDPNQATTISPNQWTRGVDRTLILPWETMLAV